ncbi:hypothetical protein VNI00_015303 [Paramarasmius palmivorus]|uniref:Uncharacterized protein n=1 Tax=Paramarasmius palmivorus TaxID=297713 RepID=A0AAW0BMS7_9AGAR
MSLVQLLEEPFGPYEEFLALEPGVKTSMKDLLHMKSVVMVNTRTKKTTGLDYTDLVQHEGTELPKVHFYGVIVIEKLSWLTPEVQKHLNNDIKGRDEELHRSCTTTLEKIYKKADANTGEERLVKMYLRCTKSKPAGYMTMDDYPKSLVLTSSVHRASSSKVNRNFVVDSLHVETHARSRNTLERWRLHALIKHAIDQQNKPPVETRTFKWIIDSMLKYHHDFSIQRRIIFDPEDSDIEDVITGETKRRRHLCRVSRHECAGILAAHAEWLLAQQVVTQYSKHHLVNLRSLYKFCMKAKSVRKTKAKANKRSTWGLEYQIDSEPRRKESDQVDLSRFGKGDWESAIERHCLGAPKVRVVSCIAVLLPIYRQKYILPPLSRPRTPPRPDTTGQFDSDYSVSSSAEESDSDSDSDISRALYAKIPKWPMRRIRFINGRWQCPERQCLFEVDLLGIQATHPERPGKYCKHLAVGHIKDHTDEHLHGWGVHFLPTHSANGQVSVRLVEWPLRGRGDDDVKMEED